MVKISILSGGVETVLLETKKQTKPHAEPIALVQRASLQTLLAERLRTDSSVPKNGVPPPHDSAPRSKGVSVLPEGKLHAVGPSAQQPTVREPPQVLSVGPKQPLSPPSPVFEEPSAPEPSTVVPQKSLPPPLPRINVATPPPLQYKPQVPVPSAEPHHHRRSHAQFHVPQPLEETESSRNDGDDDIDLSVRPSYERPAQEFDPVAENPKLVEKIGEDAVRKMFSKDVPQPKSVPQPFMSASSRRLVKAVSPKSSASFVMPANTMFAVPTISDQKRSMKQSLPPPRSVDMIGDEKEGTTDYVRFDLSLPIWKQFPRTMAKPGSETKALVCAWRYANGFPLWHPDDWNDHGAPKHLRDGEKLLTEDDLKQELAREEAYLKEFLEIDDVSEETYEDVLPEGENEELDDE